jgi:hypothetical protein
MNLSRRGFERMAMQDDDLLPPRLGQEGGNVVDRPGGKLRQDVAEVFAQVDLEAFAGLHEREDGCDFWTSFLASDMQPVLATNGQATHGILAEVLIDLDATILEVDLQARPLVEGVLAGFCEFA